MSTSPAAARRDSATGACCRCAVGRSPTLHRSDTQLVRPATEYLDSYTRALGSGWSPNTTRPEAAQEDLARIVEDPELFLARQVDREAKGAPVVLPDGSTVPRLPGYSRWMWDGEFCGIINFRWQLGTTELPPHCLGHIGYSVVPWKRGRGYATEALRMHLEGIEEEANVASVRVIEANCGVLVERFAKGAAYGGGEGLRYRISLPPTAQHTVRAVRSNESDPALATG
jgi:predicted acetyltransferase